MEVTILGSGTSGGIPEPGCHCAVCVSDNIRNNRTRCSVFIEYNETRILIDTATEFRIQALRENIEKIDAVLLTHAHADHISGLDDIRNYTRKEPVPVFGAKNTLEEVRERFSYIFRQTQKGGGKPRIFLNPVKKTFHINGITIDPIEVKHGELTVLAYRINDFAYVTDCSAIPTESMKKLRNLKVLVLDGLRQTPHETHFSIPEALNVIEKLNPERAWLTHFCHRVEHEEMEKSLPSPVKPAYDGLKIIL